MYIYLDLGGSGAGMPGRCYPSSFSLPMILHFTRYVPTVLVRKLSDLETLVTPFDRGVHIPRTIFGLTPGRDPSTIGFDIFKLKFVETVKLLESVMEVSFVVERMPENEVNRPLSTARVVLHHN